MAAGKRPGEEETLLSHPQHSSCSPQPPQPLGCNACAHTLSLLYILPKKIKRHCPINYVSSGAIFFPESPTGSHIRFPGSLASSLATR